MIVIMIGLVGTLILCYLVSMKNHSDDKLATIPNDVNVQDIVEDTSVVDDSLLAKSETFRLASEPRRIQQYILRQDHALQDKFREHLYQQKEMAFGRIAINALGDQLTAKDDRLKVLEESVKLKSDEIQIEKREAKAEIMEDKLKVMGDALNVERSKIELSAEQNKLILEKIKVAHEANRNTLDSILNKIQHAYQNMVHAKNDLELSKKNALVEIYAKELLYYETTINASYRLQMQDLRLRERENSVSYREKKVKLENLFQKTIHSLDTLKHYGFGETSFSRQSRENRYLQAFMSHHYDWLSM